MKILALTLLVAISALLVPQAEAQRSSNDRYEEPSRFPILRKAFRQIRGDVRYHAKAIRETASDLRRDVSTTIRGETPTPQYGYRGEPSDRGRQPVPAYEDYYEEPPIYQPQPRPRRQVERRPPAPRDVEPEPQPKIVAPRPNQPGWMEDPRVKNPAPKIEKQPAPKPEKKPAPKPQPKPEPKPEATSKPKPESKPEPEVVKKETTYPVAKRSDRPGFHHSPFPPYELLDTQGIEPGQLAKDPGNGKIFRIPK